MLGLVMIILAGFSGGNNVFGKKLGANLAYTQGNVEYKKANSNWQKAESDIELSQGDSVRVSGEGKAIVDLDDGSALRLNNDSAITLTAMGQKHVVITNDQGEVYSRIANLEKRVFEIKAGDTTYQSLGTAYKTINREKIKGVEVYQSKVKIIGVDKKNNLLVEQGERYYLVYADQKDKEKKVEEISLDEIKKDDFVMWNKGQDEKIDEFKSEQGVLFDLEAPKLEISSPKNDLKTTDEFVTVKGETEDGAKVLINEQGVEVKEGEFTSDYKLVEGVNNIKIEAVDSAGNKIAKSLKVTKKAPEPTPTETEKETASPKPTASETQKAKITLSGSATDSGIKFTWEVQNIDITKGFKLVKSENPDPVYPGNDYQYLSDSELRAYTWKITDGKTYYFRICRYTGEGCENYSNNVQVTAPFKEKETSSPTSKVKSITLSVGNGATVTWTVDGTSEKGFKVVYSKNSAPTYPTRDGDKYQYLSDPAAKSATIDAFSGAGLYYVRVCEYLGGACGAYSNEAQINLQ